MKKSYLFLVAMTMALALSACGGKSADSGTTGGSTVSADSVGGESISAEGGSGEAASSKDTMTIGCYGATQSMFPGNDSKLPGAQIHVNMYDTLLRMDQNGEILPLLAESWEQVDELTYRFQLKQGVKFHNGDELKASDVAFSLSTLCETPGAKSNSAQFDPSGFKVEGDYTVVLKTKQAFSPFLAILCHPTMSIFNQKFYEEHSAAGDLDLVACGTGPFMLKEWNEGENIVLERFDDYFGGPAKMKTLNFRYIPEASTRLMELESGGIDLMQEVPGVSVPDVEGNTDLKLWTCSGVNTSYLALNFDKYPDPLIREAVAHSVDRSQLCKICLMDAAEPLSRYVPTTVPGSYDVGVYEYDPELSKKLLAEAGYPDGITLELSYYSSSDNRRMGEFLQGMMEKAGITLVLNEMDSSAYTPFLNSRQQEAAICTTVCTLRDPYQTLSKLYSGSCGEGGNRVNYNNHEFDEKLNAACAETDIDKRTQLYADLQQYLQERVVYIPLYNMKVLTATTAKIRGFDLVYPTNYQRYNTCYFVD